MASLFDLNERIFAAMDELDAAEGDEEKKVAIEKARAKATLFNIAINNANTIARVAQMSESTMDGLAMQVGASSTLLGKPQIVADVDRPALPPSGFDAVAWVRGNASGHTLSWIRDRLGKVSGAEYSFDEVRGICAAAGVEPAKPGGSSLRGAEAETYAGMPRASDGRL